MSGIMQDVITQAKQDLAEALVSFEDDWRDGRYSAHRSTVNGRAIAAGQVILRLGGKVN